MEVTRVENVTRNYNIGEVETQALRGVTLGIDAGEFTALVGSFRFWKNHPFTAHGLPGPTHLGQSICEWQRCVHTEPQPTRRRTQGNDRVHLPIFCPDPHPDSV